MFIIPGIGAIQVAYKDRIVKGRSTGKGVGGSVETQPHFCLSPAGLLRDPHKPCPMLLSPAFVLEFDIRESLPMSNLPRLELLRLLVSRLERLSVDSRWARRASGLRGNIIKVLEEAEQGEVAPGRIDLLDRAKFRDPEESRQRDPGYRRTAANQRARKVAC